MNKISAVVITKNEEKNIERCLKSVCWVDEIIVYDSGSIDQTVELAKKLGAKVFQGEWKGFGSTKKLATEMALNNWILSLDADEEVTLELKSEINLALASKLEPEAVFLIPRLSNYLNCWVRHGGWYPDRQLRLFNKTCHQWNTEPIHEKVMPQLGKNTIQRSLKSHLNHFVFKNIEHQVETNNRYSTLQAQKMFRENIKMNWFHYLTKPAVKFIECYFFKFGFLDGWVGYLIARNAAYSVFLKWSKLKELYDIKK